MNLELIVWQAVEYSAGALGILGAILLAKLRRSGYICWIVNNALWVIFGLHNHNWGLAGQFMVFWFISIYGYMNWRKNVR